MPADTAPWLGLIALRSPAGLGACRWEGGRRPRRRPAASMLSGFAPADQPRSVQSRRPPVDERRLPRSATRCTPARATMLSAGPTEPGLERDRRTPTSGTAHFIGGTATTTLEG